LQGKEEVMDFKESQIWKSEKHGSTITILCVSENRVTFKIETEAFDHTTEWCTEVFEQFITDHGFELVNTLEK
jgi:hypothetical protein